MQEYPCVRDLSIDPAMLEFLGIDTQTNLAAADYFSSGRLHQEPFRIISTVALFPAHFLSFRMASESRCLSPYSSLTMR